MYNKVIDPQTNKSYSITSKKGREILNKYTQKGGKNNNKKKKSENIW